MSKHTYHCNRQSRVCPNPLYWKEARRCCPQPADSRTSEAALLDKVVEPAPCLTSQRRTQKKERPHLPHWIPGKNGQSVQNKHFFFLISRSPGDQTENSQTLQSLVLFFFSAAIISKETLGTKYLPVRNKAFLLYFLRSTDFECHCLKPCHCLTHQQTPTDMLQQQQSDLWSNVPVACVQIYSESS